VFPSPHGALKLHRCNSVGVGAILNEVKAYLLGRAKRSEYWIWIVCLTIGTGIANLILRNPSLVSGLSFIPWTVIASRRLRDFGWSPWWCVSTVVAGFVIGLVASMVNAAAKADGGHSLIGPAMLMVAYGLANWGIIIFIGSRKGLAQPDKRAAKADAALLQTFD
jgi:uncharacterized membrane protein YhaH (DUF805 family)